MNILFERLNSQSCIEQILGLNGPEDLKNNKKILDGFRIPDHSSLTTLSMASKADAAGFFYKGLYSLSECILGVSQERYSWSVIKSYYSVYYFLRCIFLLDEKVLVKNGSGTLYKIPLDLSGLSSKLSAQRGEHPQVIDAFQKTFNGRFFFLSNEINGMPAIEWIKSQREHIQYRAWMFPDPKNLSFIAGEEPENLDLWLESYINDALPIYCFDKDHACLALPIKCLIETVAFDEEKIIANEIATFKGCFSMFPSEIKNLLERITGYDFS